MTTTPTLVKKSIASPLGPNDFFHIELSRLGDRRIFPFQLYLYNPLNNKYYLFLHGNNPLISDRWQLMNTILSNGGGLAVRIDQKNTFLTTLEISEKDVPSLSGQPQVTQQAKKLLKEIKRKQEQAEETPEKRFHLKEELLNSILGDDFNNLISQCRQEVLNFKITISHTVSLARFLVEELLYDDIFPNRVVALSYHLAKGMGINDPASLANLVVSSLLYHMGMTQMDMALLKKPNIELFDEERKKYRQHPGLTQHLLRKIQIDIDLRCFNIMLDHHERTDGSGYPNFKRQGYIDPLSLCLGAVSHILEYHYGMVTGTKTPLKNILLNIKNKTLSPGLELQFGDQVYNNLIHLVNFEELKKREQEKEALNSANPEKEQAA